MPKDFPETFLLFYLIKKKVKALLLDGFLFIWPNKPVHNFPFAHNSFILSPETILAFQRKEENVWTFASSYKMESAPFYCFIGC